MNAIELINLYSEDTQKIVIKGFENYRQEAQNLQKLEYSEIRNISTQDPIRTQHENAVHTKYKNKRHALFVETCLIPQGYKDGAGEVYASVREIELSSELAYISISLITPAMAYTDCRYFIEGNDDEDSWWRDYRPYFYEFTTTLDINSNLYSIIAKKEIGEWFKAKLLVDDNEDNDLILNGALNYGGSKAQSDSLKLLFSNDKAGDLSRKLSQIYKVNIKSSKKSIKAYLDSISSNVGKGSVVRVLNVGQANCIRVSDPNSKTSLFFDVGRPLKGYYNKNGYVHNTDLDSGTDVTANIGDLNLYKPTCVLISHWHFDHFAAYINLRDYGLNSTWLVPKIDKGTIVSASRLMKYFQKHNASSKAPDIFCVDGVGKLYDNNNGFQLWKGKVTSNLNTGCLILRIDDTLLSGDSLYQYWPQGLTNDLGGVKNLIVPHHGSSLGNAANKNTAHAIISCFSDKQKYAYVSCGFNVYNHPDADHINELKNKQFIEYKTPLSQNLTSKKYYEFVVG